MMGASGQDLPAHGELRVLSTAALDSTAVLILIPQRNRSTEKQPEGSHRAPGCLASARCLSLSLPRFPFYYSHSPSPLFQRQRLSTMSTLPTVSKPFCCSRIFQNAPPPPELIWRQKNNLEETQGTVVTPQTVNQIMASRVCLCWNLPYSLIFILLSGTSMAGGDESGPSSSSPSVVKN